MKNQFIKKTFFILVFSLIGCSVFCQNTPKPYEDGEFSQTSKDIRRFEIITLGSLPFVTFDTIIVYSGIKWYQNDFNGGFPNPFTAKNSFSQDEMKNIIITSVGISFSIAITDFIINKIKQNKNSQQLKKNIIIEPEETENIVLETNIENVLYSKKESD